MSTQYWSSSTILRMPLTCPSMVARRFRICFLSVFIGASRAPPPPWEGVPAELAYHLIPCVANPVPVLLAAQQHGVGTSGPGPLLGRSEVGAFSWPPSLWVSVEACRVTGSCQMGDNGVWVCGADSPAPAAVLAAGT